MNDSKISFQEWSKRFKIPRLSNNIKNRSYPEIKINRSNMHRIFTGLTILFIGDASIRTLYRDFVCLFIHDRFLQKTEAAMKHGEYRVYEGSHCFLYE